MVSLFETCIESEYYFADDCMQMPALDEAMSAYERMQKRLSTPSYARKSIRARTKKYPLLARLNKEMGPDGDGWSDLVSLDAKADKGVIHRGIDSTYWLAWLFRKVRRHILLGVEFCDLCFLNPVRSASMPNAPAPMLFKLICLCISTILATEKENGDRPRGGLRGEKNVHSVQEFERRFLLLRARCEIH